jgi:hypothetical protein
MLVFTDDLSQVGEAGSVSMLDTEKELVMMKK